MILVKSWVVGSYLVNELDKVVIPNISFVNELTKEVALTGIEKGSAVAISTKGLLKGKNKQKLLDYIVDEIIKEIQPKIVILYNVAVKSSKLEEIVARLKSAGAKVVIPPNKLLIRNQILEVSNMGRYELPITGPNGKIKTVIAVFQIDIDKNIPRLVTNYVKKKGVK